MSNNDEQKIIQLMPADGWWVLYRDKDGKETNSKLVAWALRDDGWILPLDGDALGELDDPRDDPYFVSIEYVDS